MKRERPLDCCNCERPTKVVYTRVVNGEETTFEMCEECPMLQKMLQGFVSEKRELDKTNGKHELCCGVCGTDINAVRERLPLGCKHCYEAFGDVIVYDLLKSNKISKTLLSHIDVNQTLHVGRAEKNPSERTPALELASLHEALNDALCQEDYERAAILRDQIKFLIRKIQREK